MVRRPRDRVRAARAPGTYGRAVLRSEARRTVAAIVALAVSLVVLGLLDGFRSNVFLALEVAAIVSVLVIDRLASARLERRLQGVRGEQRVGAILDSLAGDGWLTVHDLPTGRGNIDHVAVGPGGVVTVETKSHRGVITVAQLGRPWLAQAYAQRKHLEQVIGEPVDSLLVFSHAYLIGQAVSRRRGVLVLPARMLANHLRNRVQRLSQDEISRLHAQVLAALEQAV